MQVLAPRYMAARRNTRGRRWCTASDRRLGRQLVPRPAPLRWPKRVDTFAVIQHATTEAVQLGTIGTDYFPDLTTPDLEHTTPFQQPGCSTIRHSDEFGVLSGMAELIGTQPLSTDLRRLHRRGAHAASPGPVGGHK